MQLQLSKTLAGYLVEFGIVARKMQFELKANNVAADDFCVLCGSRTEPNIPAEVFLAGTWDHVCDGCQEKYCPGLRHERVQKVEDFDRLFNEV